MNQGYDVVEFIRGNKLKPADYPLLQYQFLGLPYELEAEDLLERFKTVIPMFRELNGLAFRELIVESQIVAVYPAGAVRDEKQRLLDELSSAWRARPCSHAATRLVVRGRTDLFARRVRHFFLHHPGRRGHAQTGEPRTAGDEARARPVLRRDEPAVGPAARRNRDCRCQLRAGGNPARTMLKLMSSNEEVAHRHRLDLHGARTAAPVRAAGGPR